ncbi:hypothetical protein F3Y22_tig00111772pilonHSYRG00172 [Hibiscus syriacus]|uniref:Reverse transcriptase Ty1/copia-type domain-containing protein n=1 Tax=Hibiscus syriacus TaxID=106335 RepID=A0A6A2YDE9_HIBSY|nr:hypothetical protein F3Y22_tig00111772pilonHSYRG00172 [Hibiscus syriacus]
MNKVVDGGFHHTSDDVDTTASENVAPVETDGIGAEASDDYDSVGGNTIAISEPDVNVPPSRVHPMMTRSRSGIFKSKVFSSVVDDDVPATILVRFPEGRTVVGCKWLFRIKRNPDGSIHRYKAHLVAKGFSQIPRYDFKNTFSHVVHFFTFNTVLAIAVSNGWEPRHIDINNAFLNGDLSEDVYMQQPPGFEQVDEHGKALVCKLQKALYAGCATPMVVSSKLSHEEVKRIFRYLSSTLNFGLLFSPVVTGLNIVAFADAYWGASIDDRHSITRYGDEYKSVAEATTDITWVNILLTDLDIQQCREPVVWCDNTSDVAMSTNPVYHAQSKHVDLDVHFVREKVADGQLWVVRRETTQLSEQHKRLSVRDLASKFDKNLATVVKLADEANLREVASLEGHAILKKLRGALKSLRGCMAGRNKEDVEKAISIISFINSKQAEIISDGQKVSVTTANPIDSGLGSYVETLLRKSSSEFNVRLIPFDFSLVIS